MREQQHALFAQGIAAIAGQHVEQIMRVARTVDEPFDQIGKSGPPEPFGFGHQTRRRQAFGLHEVAIGVGQTALGSAPQRRVIVKDFRQVRFGAAQVFAVRRHGEITHAFHKTARWQRFENFENKAGVFFVLDQRLKTAHRAQRAILRLRAIRVPQNSAISSEHIAVFV